LFAAGRSVLRIVVLGAAAGGGFPQWNAAGEASRRARDGDPAARPASQAGLAISADGERWVLVNASPDLRQQIEATPVLRPKQPPRSSPIAAVLLTNGDVDAVAGLLTLREGTPLALYAHPAVLGILDANPIFEVLSRRIVPRRPLALDAELEPADASGAPLGFALVAFAAPGKPPLYLEGDGQDLVTDAETGEVLGLELRHAGRRAVYLANCAAVTEPVRRRVAGADLLFMDGTLWRDDEMIAAGVSPKTGRRMGHVSIDGPDGVMARLAGVPVGRRILIHVNNTNPALLADSAERATLVRAGWEVAWDGMELSL
jgi:pyrroloquinoline quinone biosynthesis protein B